MCVCVCVCVLSVVEGRKNIGLAIVQDIPNNNNKGLVSARPSNKPRHIVKKKAPPHPQKKTSPVLQTTEMVCFPSRGKEAINFLQDGMQIYLQARPRWALATANWTKARMNAKQRENEKPEENEERKEKSTRNFKTWIVSVFFKLPILHRPEKHKPNPTIGHVRVTPYSNSPSLAPRQGSKPKKKQGPGAKQTFPNDA